MLESCGARGVYEVVCIGPDGVEKWRDVIHNVVTTVGKDFALDTYIAGSSYTVTGPFVGLISSTSFVAVDADDTMTVKTMGWLEAGGSDTPTYSGNRPIPTFGAASGGSKAFTAPVVFSITGPGTVVGAFLCLGPGAANTKDSTGGTLYSCGTFTVSKTVDNGDTVNVSYTAGL